MATTESADEDVGVTEVDTSEHAESSADDDLPVLEQHRTLVRETDKTLANIYGYGGGAVLAVFGGVELIGYLLGFPWMALPIAATSLLVALFVLRTFVNRKRGEYLDRVRAYCELNDVDPEALREYYTAEGIYPYFVALFETRERP
jgi:hypothetical protein